MPITQAQFRTLREHYSHRSSWALWREQRPGRNTADGIDVLTIFDESNRPWEKLHPEFVFVGLNPSNDEATAERFSMFHSRRQGARDYRLRYALRGTAFWGGYCTDVFHDRINVDGSMVRQEFEKQCENDPALAQNRINDFRTEIEKVRRICERDQLPMLIAMGEDVSAVLRLAVDNHFLTGYQIITIPHYAARGRDYASNEDYRRIVWNNLGIEVQQIVPQAPPHRNATRSGERAQQYCGFWTHFMDWCVANGFAFGHQTDLGRMYYDIPGRITVSGDRLRLRFTVGDENGAPWVATEIYCKDGQEQRNRIVQYRAQFEASIFGDSAPDQDWDTPPPHRHTIARVVRFIRRADWRNADKALFAQMAADYDTIREILKTIEK